MARVLWPRPFDYNLYHQFMWGYVALEDYNILQDPYVYFCMYVDANRTGDLNQLMLAELVPQWTPGAAGQGAVILVNNDDDDATEALDCADNGVNSNQDEPDLAPLFFRLWWPYVPPGWGASLQVDRPDKIRIFNSLRDGGQEIIGPSTGRSHTFTPLELNACLAGLYFGMEGVAYAAGDFDGIINLTFSLAYPGHDMLLVINDTTQVCVAPWIMMHHGMQATDVYVADLDFNEDFRDALRVDVQGAGCVLQEKAPATECKLMSAEDLIDIGKMYHARNAARDRDKDGMVYLLEQQADLSTLLRPACIVSPRMFDYDADEMTLAELADRCSLTMNAPPMTERQLLDYADQYGETNEQYLNRRVDPRRGRLAIPGFFYIARTDATELRVDYLWGLCLRFHPAWWLEELFAEADADGVTNAERLLIPGQTIDLPNKEDQWMQDCMEIGFSSIPGHKIHAVLRAKRNRGLRAMPQSLLGNETGFHAPVATRGASTFDSHGNLEVTPPFAGYPWGRIYYGGGRRLEPFDPAVKDFLEKQIVQKPIELETGWLSVGHVDEMLTFVPIPDGASVTRADFPYKLVIASPRRAYELLRANEWARPQGGVFRRRPRRLRYKGVFIERPHILALLGHGIPGLCSKDELRMANLRMAQFHLDTAKDKLKAEMGLQDTDIIEAPILFYQNEANQFDALTTGTVNMIVINDHCIIPRPFGPIVGGVDLFENDLDQKLTALGLTTHWIDDWDEYHTAHGEVHCGTNTLREPAPADLEWWNFE